MFLRVRIPLVMFLLIICLGVVTLVIIMGRPRLQLTPLSRELTRGNVSGLVGDRANGKKIDAVSIDQLTGKNGATETIMRTGHDPVDFQVFPNTGSHLMYLYDRILSSNRWVANHWNLAEFRKKLSTHIKMSSQDDFILTQQNSRLGDLLPYSYTNTRTNSKGKKFYYKLSRKFIAEDIPPVSPLSGKKFRRCSVVGNSGIISNSKCGRDIDQADYVIRSNLPPIRSHAVDAGWKSNLTTMNPSVAQRRFNSLKSKENSLAFVRAIGDYYGVLWLPCVASTAMIGLCLKAKHTLDSYGVRNPERTVANPLHFLAVSDFWNERNLTHFLSTGFYMTHLALTMCEETHLYGFWPFPTRVADRDTDSRTNRMRKVKYHYFDQLAGPGVAHSMQDEFSVLLQMHAQGVLNLHVRDCSVD